MRMQLYEQGGRGHGGCDQKLETRAEVLFGGSWIWLEYFVGSGILESSVKKVGGND